MGKRYQAASPNFYHWERSMFGSILADLNCMTDDEYRRYRAAYCGLCRTLGARHGQISRLSLTFDMTFLLLFLGALYEPEETETEFRCLLHPKHRRTAVTTRFTDYAADMNVLLAYLNFLDDWQDDRHLSALLASGFFRSAHRKVADTYPRQAQAVRDAMERLSAVERSNSPDLDAGADCFGELLGALFIYDVSDYWAPRLDCFGRDLGKFIYYYDACMDFAADRKAGKYNPIVQSGAQELDVVQARDTLTLLISACTKNFEGLPILQDNGIIRNILYSGVWLRFNDKFKNDGSTA